MRVNNVLGIVFANMYDTSLQELTTKRALGSVPFAGRYRLIDFMLSDMVNSGIGKVGVITKSNYQSLMDHLGNGKPWDLARKTEGMYLLPPFYNMESGMYQNRIEALYQNRKFMERSVEEYIVLSDCIAVTNFDFGAFLQAHTEKEADITLAYYKGEVANLDDVVVLNMDDEDRVQSVEIGYQRGKRKNVCINVMIIKKDLLVDLVTKAHDENRSNFVVEIIKNNIGNLKICGYKVPDFCKMVSSLTTYYEANMALLNKTNNKSLFNRQRPIYTKVRDDMPAKYGLHSKVKNSLVADGCVVNGTVDNSILFRGVTIEEGVTVKDSILMQGATVKKGADLKCVILDKNVTVSEDKSLDGVPTYPVYVSKEALI